MTKVVAPAGQYTKPGSSRLLGLVLIIDRQMKWFANHDSRRNFIASWLEVGHFVSPIPIVGLIVLP